MTKFFSRLSYSFGNEDWKTESEALKLTSTDRVLCVTGSGDRPLNLLVSSPREVVAIDLNPIQNHLLALKSAALQELEFSDYSRFLGLTPSEKRLQVLQGLPLDDDARACWTKNAKMVEKGVLYQGTLERILGKIAGLIALLRSDKVERLFSIDNLEEQREFVRRYWHKPAFRKILQIFTHPALSKMMFNDPGLYANLPASLNIGAYLYDRIQNYLHNFLAKESLLLNLILNRRVVDAALPPYLREKETALIRNNLGSLTTVTDNIVTYLENAPEQSFDGFSLADVASYITEKEYLRLLHALKRAARPGARFCMRQFLSAHQIPMNLASHFKREKELEEKLEREDRCMLYRFTVGTIE